MAACTAMRMAVLNALSSLCGEGAGSLTSWSRLSGQALEQKWASSWAIPGRPLLPPEPGGMGKKGQATKIELLGQEFSQVLNGTETECFISLIYWRLWLKLSVLSCHWWCSQRSRRSSTLRHKGTKEALWVEDLGNVPWVGRAHFGDSPNYAQTTDSGITLALYEMEYRPKSAWLEGLKKAVNTTHIFGDATRLCKAGQLKEVLHILNQGGIQADSNTYIYILQECINRKALTEGKQVHAHIIQSGFRPSIFLLNALVNMYAKCGSMADAWQVFNKMTEQDTSTWNIMISGYAKHGCCREALEIYEKMTRERVSPNKETFMCILKACASLTVLEKGIELHADILKAGIAPNIVLENTLVDMYAKCGSIKDARQVFDSMAQRNVVSWNAMTAGYARCGCGREAFEIYEQMIGEGIRPNKVTFICVLKACASLAALEKGTKVHADIMKSGIVPDTILETALVNMYAKCGSIKDACLVFENMTKRDVVSWNAMLAGYAQHGCGGEAFEIYERMVREGARRDRVTFVCVLNACASLSSLEKGLEVHADIIKAGIVPDIILANTLVNMYAKCGSIKDAQQVFESMAERDVVSWSAMIGGYAQHGCAREAFEMYEQMIQEGVTPNRVTLICILNVCASLEKVIEIHNDIIKAGIAPDIVLETALVDMYAKCGSMKHARQVFDKMAHRDAVSWNAMLAGYVQHGCGRDAFRTYEQLIREEVTPDKVTFICILNACTSLADLEKGKEVHANVIKAGIVPDITLENSLIDMYCKCGSIKDARHIFTNMAERDVVSWNSIIAGYAQHGCGREAFEMYEQMIVERVSLDKGTFISVLKACADMASLEKCREVHAHIIQAGLAPDSILETTLIDLYAKCGSITDARQVFDNMVQRSVVSWNAMITGYAQHGCSMEAFKIYEQMIQAGVAPGTVTFICIVNACGGLAALEKGMDVHSDIVKAGIGPDIILETALVDMYAKCGNMKDALQVFDNMAQRNVVSWNTMIAGYAQHGCGRAALHLFDHMQQEGFKPDGITFICLFSACSHAGLVDEGRHYFDSMSKDHGLTPKMEHFGCMVDLLGRASRLEEAEDFISSMPIDSGASVWKILLSACRVRGNVVLAERAAQNLLKWDP